ncbi:MAG: ABC transporter ATP-binding protein [Clostridia bacterium]|nr:ABC transporter ATP-binding protein [Clostridia bacterium]
MASGIRLEGISKTFFHAERGAVHAVRSLDLVVKPGELVTLLGPSGCGKTTALRMIAGFENPTAGRIFIGERDVTGIMPNKRSIGFVFQNYALFPHMNIFENVSYGLAVKGMPISQRHKEVADVLQLVGLEGMERRQPSQLSGGEQQRVALARVIVTHPEVLLLDEPLSNLDAKRRVQMRSEIRRLQQSLNITSLYVTHDQEEALSISDRVIVMNQGEVAQAGSPQEIYTHPASNFVAGFIGKVNSLPAVIERLDAETATSAFAGQSFTTSRPSIELNQGDTVFLMVRPESISLAAGGDSPSDDRSPRLHGRIEGITYMGEKMEYDVGLEGSVIKVTSYDPATHGIFEPGQDVGIVLREESMIVCKA